MIDLKDFITESEKMEAIDMTDSSVQEIVKYLHQWFLFTFADGNPNPGSFYCGIANDVNTRMSAHKSQDHNGKEIKIKIAVECKDEKTAEDVEDQMGKLNFDIGHPRYKGNGAAHDSRFVYLYKKP